MIPHSRRISRSLGIVVVLGVLAFTLILVYLWAGFRLGSLNPLTSVTHQKVEESLSHVLGQKVEIGRISDFSFNHVVLENITTGEYLPEKDRSRTPISFHIPRVVISIDLWRYLWNGRKISSVSIHLHRPEVKLVDAGGLSDPINIAKGLSADLAELQLQIEISSGKFVYTNGGLEQDIVVEPIGGTLEICKHYSGHSAGRQIKIVSLEMGQGQRSLGLDGSITLEDSGSGQTKVGMAFSRVRYGRIPLGKVTGQMEYEHGGFRFKDIRGDILGSTITGYGVAAGGQRQAYDFQLDVRGIKPAGIAILTKAWEFDIPSVATELLSGLQASVRISSEAGGPRWQAAWQTRWQGNDIGGKAELNPDGIYRVEGQCRGVSLQDLFRQLPSSRQEISIDGIADLSVSIEGAWGQQPQSTLHGHFQALRVNGISLGQAQLSGELSGKQFVINEAEWDTGHATIDLGGNIKWNQEWDLWMKTPKLDVQRLPWLSGVASEMTGTVAVSGAWRGPWGQPTWKADLRGENLTWLIPGLPDAVTIPRVKAEMLGSRVDFTNLVLHYGGGIMTVDGTVLLESPENPSFDLTGNVDGIRYESEAFAGKLSGEISLQGPWPRPLLRGQLYLHQGRLDITRLGKTTPTAMDIPLAVDLGIDDGLAVTGVGLLDIMAEGALHIGGSTGALQVRGRMDVARGQIVYLGTPFQVVRGWAAFGPYEELIPDVYLEGVGEVKGVPVTLVLQGPGTDLEPRLQSEQDFSESELLAMLSIPEKITTALDDGLGRVFRREIGQLLKGQLRLHLLGGLERRLQEALDLDELQVEPGLSDGRVRLELGKYIAKDVFVAYTQTVYPYWENEWHLDYKLDHGLRMTTTWNGDRGYKLGIEMRLEF